jgi:hypothetical protein
MNQEMIAKIKELGQTAEYPASWPRVRVNRHPHWCGDIEMTEDGFAARTTCDDECCDDDNHACAALLPDDLTEATLDALLAARR